MTLNRPSRSIIRLNPGSVPEANQLASVTRALAQVRSQIVRETMGAVSPKRQLRAVDLIMQKHHDAIAAVFAASRRNGRVLAPVDALQLVISLIEHITMASYWLQLARNLRKIPAGPSDQRDQSPEKSRKHRLRVLARIESNCQLAIDMMNELHSLAPLKGRGHIDRLFERFDLQILCVQTLATVAATDSASGGPPLPESELKEMLSELDQIRQSPGFRSRSSGDQGLLWQAVSVVQAEFGNKEGVRAALAERRRLIGNDSDSRLLLLADLIPQSETSEERLELVAELRTLAKGANIGPVFSRARLGRMSILRDSYWYLATTADVNDPIGRALFDDCFACYEEWIFGKSVPMTSGTVRLFTMWRGEAGLAWLSDGTLERRPLTLDPELAARLVFAMEGNPGSERKVLRDAMTYLASVLSPVLAQAFNTPGERRIQAVGQMGILPILAAPVSGRALGASPEVAYRHPNTAAAFQLMGRRGHVELAVIDKCFGSDAQNVAITARAVASAQDAECQVLYFDSENDTLPVSNLLSALSSAASAVIFCHVDNPVANANAAGLILGSTSRLTVEALAAADLHSLEELALIGCASGRSNPFVGEATLAHAAALAGAGEILYTLWPIRPSEGSKIAVGLLEARSHGQTMREFLAHQFEQDALKAAAFAMMRP